MDKDHMNRPILEVLGVSKYFGGIKANDDISLSLTKGEIVSIIGPNGAGKSTLFKMMCGVKPQGSSRKPDSGKVLFCGQDITRAPAHIVCKYGLTLVFQETEPLRNMTAIENIAIGALVHDKSFHSALKKAERIIDEINMSHRKDVELTELTLAELKRLEIGRALATRPKVLMLDETMAGLTPTEVKESVGLVREINKSGVSIVLIEHVLEAVMAVSDRVIVLDQGRKISEGSPQEVVNDPVVIKAYLGGDADNA
jgi:branched-chain amino acid transport system ATP-binding protein